MTTYYKSQIKFKIWKCNQEPADKLNLKKLTPEEVETFRKFGVINETVQEL